MTSRIHNWNRFRLSEGILDFNPVALKGRAWIEILFLLRKGRLESCRMILWLSSRASEEKMFPIEPWGAFWDVEFYIQINFKPNNKLTQHINSDE